MRSIYMALIMQCLIKLRLINELVQKKTNINGFKFSSF